MGLLYTIDSMLHCSLTADDDNKISVLTLSVSSAPRIDMFHHNKIYKLCSQYRIQLIVYI